MKLRKGPDKDTVTYRESGVDIEAGRKAVDLIRQRVKSTFRSEVLGDIGGFGGGFAFDSSKYKEPILVSGTDGAGTKVLIAQKAGVHNTIGIDLVAMSVNDVSAHGAEPLFFLDYIVTDKVEPHVIEQIVEGVAEGCLAAGCALIGGETAEHPGHILPGSYDLAGTCVGVVERSRLVTGEAVREGDAIIGIESSGLHSNGFSLVRKVLFDLMELKLSDRPIDSSETLGEELLKPTLIYSPVITALCGEVEVHGLAHVTGGGIPENLGRVLPEDLSATVDKTSWQQPKIFDLLSDRVPEEDMFNTFNMGLGMIAVVSSSDSLKAIDEIRSHGYRAHEIGVIGGPRRSDVPVRIV